MVVCLHVHFHSCAFRQVWSGLPRVCLLQFAYLQKSQVIKRHCLSGALKHISGSGPALTLTVDFFNSYLAHSAQHAAVSLCALQPTASQGLHHPQPDFLPGAAGQLQGHESPSGKGGCVGQRKGYVESIIPDILPDWDLCLICTPAHRAGEHLVSWQIRMTAVQCK